MVTTEKHQVFGGAASQVKEYKSYFPYDFRFEVSGLRTLQMCAIVADVLHESKTFGGIALQGERPDQEDWFRHIGTLSYSDERVPEIFLALANYAEATVWGHVIRLETTEMQNDSTREVFNLRRSYPNDKGVAKVHDAQVNGAIKGQAELWLALYIAGHITLDQIKQETQKLLADSRGRSSIQPIS